VGQKVEPFIYGQSWIGQIYSGLLYKILAKKLI